MTENVEKVFATNENKPLYEMTIDLNVLNHLGIGLYSNIPAVVSEVVANSYDADATVVRIDIDKANSTISIADDGWGMTRQEINGHYLKVGYRKRDDTRKSQWERIPMGRKGIGKLSLFSIADTIEVHSVKTDEHENIMDRNAFAMSAREIKLKMETGDERPYCPTPIPPAHITKGTMISIRDLKLDVDSTESFLRRRLARRFSIIGPEHNFEVYVNGDKIDVEDRDYFSKVQYLWYLGTESAHYAMEAKNSTQKIELKGNVDEELGYCVTGWVGTFDEQKSIEEGNNSIVILARGKLIHEDILRDLKEGGIFTKYLIGEVRADFLDTDDKDDIATSDRQSLKESDPRFKKLKEFIQSKILKEIQSKWTDFRKSEAEVRAREDPSVDEWFNQLEPDNKRWAQEIFAKIESFPIESKEYKDDLYRHGILAFETLALKKNLGLLEHISTEKDFDLFNKLFAGIDQLEEAHYYQIAKGRLAVLAKFEDILPEAKERLIQEHIFEHLWLLDPSWERASTDARFEQSVTKEFEDIDAKLTAEEKSGRIDIRYRTAAGAHIIIELKKFDRSIDNLELLGQVSKYKSALEKCLKISYPDQNHAISIICLVGDRPLPKENDVEHVKLLAVYGARYITYDDLIRRTRDSYRDYLEAQKKINRIQQLIDNIGKPPVPLAAPVPQGMSQLAGPSAG